MVQPKPDKVITIEMPWTMIRSTNEAGLAVYILNQMSRQQDRER